MMHSAKSRYEKWGFVDALDADSLPALQTLSKRMQGFYTAPNRTKYWAVIEDDNKVWTPEKHPYHCHLRAQMRRGENVVDFGCGGTHAWENLQSAGVKYTGLEWATDQAARNQLKRPDATYIAGDMLRVDFELKGSADWAISLFALEHCPFPNVMIDRMVDATRVGGRIAIICPDFQSGMPSLRSGLSALTRREKLRRLRVVDLAFGLVQDRFIWPRRLRELARSSIRMPIYLIPRCLDADYYSDNDAVYLASEGRIVNYMESIGLKVSIRSNSIRIPYGDSVSFCYIIAVKD